MPTIPPCAGIFLPIFWSKDSMSSIRTPLTVSPHEYFGDITGRPLDYGTIYFGEPDKDPEFYPIDVYSDEALTQPIPQPIRTKGGFINVNGDIIEIFGRPAIYSVKVLDQYGRKIFYKGKAMRNNVNDDIIAEIDAAIQQSKDDGVEYAKKAVREAIDDTVTDGSPIADTMISVDGSLSQRTINKGLESIADLSTIKNPKDGLRVYVKSYHAGLNKGGGYFTYNESKKAINDGGFIFNGWARENVADITPVLFGAKGDGVTDTLAIQRAIDAAPDGGSLYFTDGTYKVSKNTTLPNFPKNDQPCLFVYERNNLSIIIGEGATIFVDEHAQGVFEMQRSNGCVIVNNGIIKSNATFPPLDGTTGRGEKGTDTEGYPQIVPSKNNSNDTSSNTTGGYGKKFPRQNGGNGATWGVWHGGYIGNVGHGILIHNDCHKCGVTGTGEVYGFNGTGIQIGWDGANYQPSIDCFVKNTNVHNCYAGGIFTTNCRASIVTGNTVYKIGHPDAKKTDVNHDPGYGIATPYSDINECYDNYYADNFVYDCVRKGIDLHSGINTTIKNNRVVDCWTNGIYAGAGNDSLRVTETKITGNTIIRCGSLPESNVYKNVGAILAHNVMTDIGSKKPNKVTIEGNTIKDCVSGGGILSIWNGADNIIRNNTISTDSDIYVQIGNNAEHSAISIGAFNDTFTADNTIVEGNTIYLNNKMVKGVVTRKGFGRVAANTVHMGEGSVIGYEHLGTVNDKFDFINNHAFVEVGRAYITQTTGGKVEGNTSTLLSSNAYHGSDKGSKATGVRFASARITFNGTNSPALTILKGDDVIAGVSSANEGVKLNLKNITSDSSVFAQVTLVSYQGLVLDSGFANYFYVRWVTKSEVIIGIQTQQDTSHIPTASIKAGALRVDMFITE